MAPAVNFTGLASGIDSSSLIKAVLDQARNTRIKPLEAKITQAQDTNSALGELKTLLDTLKEKTQSLRAINGSAISKSATSSNETSVIASANNGSNNGTYSISVAQLARSGTASFDDRFSSSGSVINGSINNGASAVDRTVSVTVGSGASQETVAVELTSTSTVSEFVNSFNAQSSQAQASIINVGTTASPSYAVVLNSDAQGTELGEIAISVGSEITSAGGGSLTSNTLQQAQNANFTISGISGTLSRSSNEISDVVSGINFSLKATGSASITVADNKSTSSETLQDLVDAYNKVHSYIKEKDSVVGSENPGEAASFGALAHSSLDENVLSELRNALSASRINNATSSIATLADLGITTQRDGSLKFDVKIFNDAIAADSSAVETITSALGERLGAVDGTVAQFTRYNGLFDTSINSNKESITNYNNRIAQIEKSIQKEQESLTARYSRLEGLIGKLNSQQSALGSLG